MKAAEKVATIIITACLTAFLALLIWGML